jgi:hypothetical protein
MELVMEEAMVMAMAMMDTKHQIASYLLKLEEQQTVVEDVPEDEDNVPIYMFLAYQLGLGLQFLKNYGTGHITF